MSQSVKKSLSLSPSNAAPIPAAGSPRAFADPGNARFSVQHYPFYLLNRAAGRYNQIIEAALRPLGVDIPTWRVLMILGEASPRSIGVVAETAVINVSTMTRIVQRMERAGLVACAAQTSDKRVTHVHITPAGQKAFEAVRSAAAPIFQAATLGFSDQDFVALTDLLNRLHDNLDLALKARPHDPVGGGADGE
jgi:DNA-binding MarR family transcriptional regulator